MIMTSAFSTWNLFFYRDESISSFLPCDVGYSPVLAADETRWNGPLALPTAPGHRSHSYVSKTQFPTFLVTWRFHPIFSYPLALCTEPSNLECEQRRTSRLQLLQTIRIEYTRVGLIQVLMVHSTATTRQGIEKKEFNNTLDHSP